MSEEILTPKELAAYLQIHLATLYRLLKAKRIPGAKVGGQWRFVKKRIDQWIDSPHAK